MSVQIAIIGCGGMASGHLNAYLKIHEVAPEKAELVAVCDPVRERAEEFADRAKEKTGKRPGVYDHTDKMLANEDLDGANICTPHAFHHVNAIKCLNAGVNVIVEKPIGIEL